VTATPLRLLAAEKVPQAVPVHADPLADQFTPAVSLVVGVTDRVCVVVMPARTGETDAVIPDDGTTVSVRLTALFWAGLLESVRVNVSGVALTVAAGVPVIPPVAALSDRFAGRAPLVRDQVYGAVPPVAVRVNW
jgi:hypothetical protein